MTDAGIKPAKPFSGWEVGLAFRYLRAKRKEGGIALIAIISYVAIALAVMALITVMSIMAGFRAELLGRMLSFNGHMYVQGAVLTALDAGPRDRSFGTQEPLHRFAVPLPIASQQGGDVKPTARNSIAFSSVLRCNWTGILPESP